MSIVLVDYNRPVHTDHLLPIGRLRDIPERIRKADIVIVTKCPAYMEESSKDKWKKDLGIEGTLLFSTVNYDELEPVFPEGDHRYVHSHRAILFTGIANDAPLYTYLGDRYGIMEHFRFGDHHSFSGKDIRLIGRAAEMFPTALVATTEKDSQRISGRTDIPERMKAKMFYAPIKVGFLTEEEAALFKEKVSALK